jgi:hypothetical protein
LYQPETEYSSAKGEDERIAGSSSPYSVISFVPSMTSFTSFFKQSGAGIGLQANAY